jgi:UDP-glucose 4-epimerase
MHILILGSEGFIGKAAVRHFLSAGMHITGCDLYEAPSAGYRYFKLSRLSPELDEVLQSANFDFFINAAGSGNVSYSVTHPFIDFEANTLDAYRILDAIRRLQPGCKYIQLSSAAVYGNPVTLPVHETAVCAPVSPYGFHKLMAETICKEFYQLFGLQVAVVRPFSVYGPGLKKQLFWDLFQKYKAGQRVIEVWGTGKESRDFIYIDDLILLLQHIMNKGAFACNIYNAASGKEVTIEKAVTTMFAQLHVTVQLRFNNQVRAGDPLNWRAGTTLTEELGFTNKTTFEQGIEKLVAWYKSQN